MKAKEDKLSFDKHLWVEYGGVEAEVKRKYITLTGKDDDSYLKVLNNFGRLYKLYTFENGGWVDTDTGDKPDTLDENLAGRLPG